MNTTPERPWLSTDFTKAARTKFYNDLQFRSRERKLLEFLLTFDGPLVQNIDIVRSGVGGPRTVRYLLSYFVSLGLIHKSVVKDHAGRDRGLEIDTNPILQAIWNHSGAATPRSTGPRDRTSTQKAARKPSAKALKASQIAADTAAYEAYAKEHNSKSYEELQKLQPPPLWNGRMMRIHQMHRTGFTDCKRPFPKITKGVPSNHAGDPEYWLSKQTLCWRKKTSPTAMQGLADYKTKLNNARNDAWKQANTAYIKPLHPSVQPTIYANVQDSSDATAHTCSQNTATQCATLDAVSEGPILKSFYSGGFIGDGNGVPNLRCDNKPKSLRC